jgi:hypothetical protein
MYPSFIGFIFAYLMLQQNPSKRKSQRKNSHEQTKNRIISPLERCKSPKNKKSPGAFLLREREITSSCGTAAMRQRRQ